MFLFKPFISAALVLWLVSFSAFAVEIKDIGVSFDPPDGFKSLSKEMIKLKFPSANAPEWVYANEDFSVTVAVKRSGKKAKKSDLNAILKTMVKTYPRIIPNLVWIEKEVAEFNGETWLHTEITSTAIDADIHNNIYMTSHRGELIALNFNSTKKMYEQYKTQLQQSFDSVKLIQ